MRTKVVFTLFAGMLLAGQANAAVLLQDNFDGYANQAAFLSAWPQVGAVASGTLSTTQAQTPLQSVNYATTAQRNEKTFTESGAPGSANIIRFSVDFYDSNAALAPYRQHTNLQDGATPSLTGQLVALGLNNNLGSAADGGNFYMGRVLGINGGAFFKLNDNPALLRSTGWHTLSVEISDLSYSFFVDGQLAETVAQAGALRSYDYVRLGSGLSSGAEAFFDNVLVETVPEPSAAVLGCAGLAALARRRRQG